MKTFLPHLLITTTLIGLTGCGSKSVGKLEVSQSFATTNTSFGGGLVISGKHLTSGRSFSHSILSGKEMRINLESGSWKISAVGWDGGGSPGTEKLFAGNPHCGTVVANLASASQVVDLTINQANCNTAEFSGGHVDATNTLKDFTAIITCNSFFTHLINPAASISSQIVSQGNSMDGFCENILLPADLKSKVQAVKIQSMEKLPGQSDFTPGSVTTGCLQGSAGAESKIYPTAAPNPYNSYTLRLPFANLPLMVTTYRDTGCSMPEAVYQFADGLVNGDPKGDHLLHTHYTNTMKLLLPGNDLKKAFSPFMAIMPYFKRDFGGNPAKFATEPGSLSFAIHGLVGPNKAILENESSCAAITPSGDVTAPSCTDLGDHVQIAFTGNAEGSGTLTMNGNVYTVYVGNTGFGAARYSSQKLVMSLLGHSGTESMDKFFELNDKDDNGYGVLSAIRNMLSPHGAGGVIGVSDLNETFTDSCLNQVADKETTMFNYEKMQLETFRVILHNSVAGSPTKFICNNADMDEANCATNGTDFDKRMLIYDYSVSAVSPAMVLEFNCTSMLGKMEINSFEIEGTKKEHIAQVINWNTDTNASLANQRFERVALTKNYIYNSGWNQVEEARTMSRVTKTGPDDYEVWNYHYSTHKNGLSTFDQVLDYKRLKTSSITNLNYITDSAFVTNANPTFILVDSAYTTILDRTPASESFMNYFYPNDTFPQGSSGTAATFNTLSTDFANANQINDGLAFKLRTLGQPAFTNSFGGSFYTAP